MTSNISTIQKHVVPMGKTTLKDSPFYPVLGKYLNIVISTKLLVTLGF